VVEKGERGNKGRTLNGLPTAKGRIGCSLWPGGAGLPPGRPIIGDVVRKEGRACLRRGGKRKSRCGSVRERQVLLRKEFQRM